MRLTKAEGEILLGAIAAELESQRYRQSRRGEYQPPLDRETEHGLREDDRERAVKLREVRQRIQGAAQALS